MTYDVIIGLEIHTEVKTKSKMFCSCSNAGLLDLPNQNVCPICLGLPGSLPLPNSKAIEACVLLGLALNSEINSYSKFDRKNYFYPDLPKGYQISQYDLPLAQGGSLKLDTNRQIDITRIHLEEDTAKSSHVSGASFIDFNRAGAPLIELVTEPVIANAHEAKKFCQQFQMILRYLQISDAEMEKGQMRCEANVSVQIPNTWQYVEGTIMPIDDFQLNAKVEIKNINSFKALEKAINYEVQRQSELLAKSEHIKPETRGWNDVKNQTIAQRRKESSADYRYFPEPDIPPLVLTGDWLESIRHRVIELPFVKVQRLMDEYNFSLDDAETLAFDPALANFAEEVISELYAQINSDDDSAERQRNALVKTATGWLTTELLKHFKINNETVKNLRFKAIDLAKLVALVYNGKINSSAGQIIFNQMYQIGGDPEHIMRAMNLEQNDSESELKLIVKQILLDNPIQTKELKAGKSSLLQYIIGKTMAQTGGKANPKILPDIIEKVLLELE